MPRHLRSSQYRALLVFSFFVGTSLFSFAQKTVVQDAGAGMKQQFDYDAAGRIVEIRTIEADGRLQARVNNAYGARSLVDTVTNTAYWPDGKSVQKIGQTTFDENSNFTSEIIQDFDQSGKHVSGHKLFHDPMTGIYRCFDWNAAQQKYLAIECPSSEESREGPTEVRKITRSEVMEDLAAARQASQVEQKSRRMKRKNPVEAPITTTNKVVGIVLPSVMRPGQRVSGSVVPDPDRFTGYPDLLVTRVTLPMESAGDASQLNGWTIELKGSAPQAADGSVSFVVPDGATALDFALRQSGNSAIAVAQTIQLPRSASQKAPPLQSYESPALCFKRDICTVSGRFSGDSRNTFAAFDRVPARIVAEADTAAYLEVPDSMNMGASTLIVAEGARVAAMTMVVAEFSVAPNHIAIEPGQDRLVYLRVNSVSELAPDQWRYGIYPASSVERARALLAGFNPAKVVEQEREQQERQKKQDGYPKKDEKWEESAGMLLVVVRNDTTDLVTLRGSKQNQYVFRFTPDSFSRGDYRISLAVDGSKSGIYGITATAIPFLAPVKAEVFDAEASAKN